jgi:cell division protein FtsL
MNVRLRRGGWLVRALGPAVVALATIIGLSVWTRTEVTALRYRISQLRDEESAMRRDVERLRIEVAALASPDRIEREARRLGLKRPRPGQIVPLRSSAGKRP